MKEGGVGKPRLLCSLGQGKEKKKKKQKGRRMRQMGQNYKGKLKKRSLGTEKDVKVIKENKTNNKIR